MIKDKDLEHLAAFKDLKLDLISLTIGTSKKFQDMLLQRIF